MSLASYCVRVTDESRTVSGRESHSGPHIGLYFCYFEIIVLFITTAELHRNLKSVCDLLFIYLHHSVREYISSASVYGGALRQQTIDVGSRLCCVAEFEQASISPSGPPLRN